MSETQGQRNDSPLLSERGVTTISDTVVSSLAGMAAQEVEGVHMGGGASRAAGGVLGSITGAESRTSGISVEIGRTEVAIDLKMGVEYNKNILQTVEEVRRRITERIESLTGLRIKELNATITDITFPEKEARRRLGPARPPSEPDESQPETPAAAPEARTTQPDQANEPVEETTHAATVQAETTEVETSEPETTEPETAAAETTLSEETTGVEATEVEPTEPETTEAETTEPETAEVEATETETTEAPTEDSGAPEEAAAPVESSGAPEEEAAVAESPAVEDEVVVGESPPGAGETAEVRTEERPVDEALESETTDEVQTPPEPETPEARMRRRAAERARRRRRRTQEEDS